MEEKQTQEEQIAEVDSSVEETKPEETITVNSESDKQTKTFTQEQVDEIVKKRLNKLYSKYNVQDKKSLDDLVSKSQSYDIMTERIENIRNENASLKEQILFLKNNIDEKKYDDIKAYFKGKEIEFNEENLLNELANHKEWEKKAMTIETLGNTKQHDTPMDEKDMASKLFGIKIK